MRRWTKTEEPPEGDEGEGDYIHPDDIEYDPEEDDALNEFTRDKSPDVPCPHCGETIAEDHQRCPHCEMYISKEDAPPEKKSPFVRIMFFLTLISILLFWVLKGF